MNSDDDDVGYGKPPKKHQFKPGKSGNPKGRPKGTRNFNTDLDEILRKKIPVTKDGTRKNVSTQLAALMRLADKALKGDGPSLSKFLDLAKQRGDEQEMQASERKLSKEENDILERFEDDLRKRVLSEATRRSDEDTDDAS